MGPLVDSRGMAFPTQNVDQPELAAWANGFGMKGYSGEITAADVAAVEPTDDYLWITDTLVTIPADGGCVALMGLLTPESFPAGWGFQIVWGGDLGDGYTSGVAGPGGLTIGATSSNGIYTGQGGLAVALFPEGADADSVGYVAPGSLSVALDSTNVGDPDAAPDTGRLKYWLAVLL